MTSIIRGFIVAIILLGLGIGSATLITSNQELNQSAQDIQQSNQTVSTTSAQNLAQGLLNLADLI